MLKKDSKSETYWLDFGKNIGIAFQLKDDLLDAFGNSDTFGKKIGGDIIGNKKTFLYLKALQLSDADTKKTLQSFECITEGHHTTLTYHERSCSNQQEVGRTLSLLLTTSPHKKI